MSDPPRLVLLICKCPNLTRCTVSAGLAAGGARVLKFRLEVSPSEMQSEVQCGSGLITDLSQSSVSRLARGEWQNEGGH